MVREGTGYSGTNGPGGPFIPDMDGLGGGTDDGGGDHQ